MSLLKSISGSRQALRESSGSSDVIVIGAGHAGLAASYFLQQHAINHEVLERGEVANSWKNERWDSLRLLTPNWQSRLPGYRYDGDDPDGFMSMPELIGFIEDYAKTIRPPLRTNANVQKVAQDSAGYRVESTAGQWHCKAVVIATGACNIAHVPKAAAALPDGITSLTPHEYRNPAQLEPGNVMIVGASATGLQLAEEIRRNGHEVTIATGEHVRMPRRYRGRDIQFWLQRTGILDEHYEVIDDLNRARNLPSPQLIGAHDPDILDLNRLQDAGVRIVGRLMGFRDRTAMFSGSLKNVCMLADLKMNRMLKTIDEWLDDHPEPAAAKDSDITAPERFEATRVDDCPSLSIDLQAENIKTIIWCTGFRPDYSWLDVDVLDAKGRLRHDGGVCSAPGLYVLGLPVLRRRKSSFIHGIEDDVNEIGQHLRQYLAAASPALRSRA